MKKVFVVLVVFVALAGYAFAGGYEVKKQAGEFAVQVMIARNPPVVGNNNVSVEIKDASGKYVTDAKVAIDYSMPAMPGMPPMNYKATGKLDGSEYKAVMNLSMSGPWNVAVKIKKGGKTSTIKFNVDAH